MQREVTIMQALKKVYKVSILGMSLILLSIVSANAESFEEMKARWDSSERMQILYRDRAELNKKIDEDMRILRAQQEIQRAKPMPEIGMHKSKIRDGTSWGYPDKVNTTIDANGSREQWVYRNSLGTRYLYFSNDKLTSIQY